MSPAVPLTVSKPKGTFLPHEIWWLVAQVFANRRDFDGLFLFARLGRAMASLALPLLYSIHDKSPVIEIRRVFGLESAVCLWRSIIASSLGETFFPYCCWIKTLTLGNLESFLVLLNNEARHQIRFFSSPLEKLQIRDNEHILDLSAICVEVADMIIDRIWTVADQGDSRVGLTGLQGRPTPLPAGKLQNWVSRLPFLTSLNVKDGSVLTSDVARAIREHCPAFNEV
jgi:hypothetical protein